MKYMTYYQGSYVPQNQLEKDQIEYMKTIDRVLLPDEESLERFKETVILELKKLNKNNPRCKPFKPTWCHAGFGQKDLFISGIRVVNFNIYVIKNEDECTD